MPITQLCTNKQAYSMSFSGYFFRFFQIAKNLSLSTEVFYFI
ncbi:hypothetical protein HMPREF0454_00177 [Hafnia alvei ATCC 51873]|uniref:Uncharacterized protein n=1 Tax=Hafnia alvei ATCC 51873 TaxID=1002364 RepID=G9Y0W9_HAFAL|nr:hypothetical protein HMPREF0454_00177 [Hafnia alvei ATCC 51873]